MSSSSSMQPHADGKTMIQTLSSPLLSSPRFYSFQNKFCAKKVWQPICFLIILGIASFLTVKLGLVTKKNERMVHLQSQTAGNRSFSEIEFTAKLILPLNSSALTLARGLSASLNGTHLSFTPIQQKIAPILFLTVSTIPFLSQASYLGSDGLLFSFYTDDDQMLAVFSNSSFSPTWYTQPVNRDDGKLYGEAVASDSMGTPNSTWFQRAMNSTGGISWLGRGWNEDQKAMFLSAVAMDGRGVISLGVSARLVVDHFMNLDFHGGYFHLATTDGNEIIDSSPPNTRISVVNGTVFVQTVKPNGEPADMADGFTCDPEDGQLTSVLGKSMGVDYQFYCSTIKIAGVESVYVLAYPTNGLVRTIHRNGKQSILLLVLLFLLVAASILLFLIFVVTAAKREMTLCASLLKQTEATQQAERKSMNKTNAFNIANHDVRASLGSISELITACKENVYPTSMLQGNLQNMANEVDGLYDILNSVLDTSKIEAGKMQLQVEEFNVAQLLEDVVGMFYLKASKQGVDLLLDPCDDSISKMSIVKGDKVKLKQILCNLLDNAVKFTSEGHITVRAMVKKKSFEDTIMASNRNVSTSFMSWLCYKNKEKINNLNALHSTCQDPNERDFSFEVEDTGIGIPKDEQASVFENFVQVFRKNDEQEGSGLGLGIVQSLVRLMKGDIRIVDKEAAERGTCFHFKVSLVVCDPDLEETTESSHGTNKYQHFSMNIRGSPCHKPCGSQVLLLMPANERRKVLAKYFESFSVKVSCATHGKSLLLHLGKMKSRLDFSPEFFRRSTSSRKSDLEANDFSDRTLPNSSSGSSSGGMILIIIDMSVCDISKMCSSLAEFKNDMPTVLLKVVWLDDLITRRIHDDERELIPVGDDVIFKPLHGLRLYGVLGLLPEFNGFNLPQLKARTADEESTIDVGCSSSNESSNNAGVEPEKGCSSSSRMEEKVDDAATKRETRLPLSGKKFLVVEDEQATAKLTTRTVQKLGADFEVCKNGKEAVDRVCRFLREDRKEGIPYDYILMDCEMPVMNGLEATREIRKEEKKHGRVHVPIIALTAHATAEEVRKIEEAGMDFHLAKPISRSTGKLLELIQSISITDQLRN